MNKRKRLLFQIFPPYVLTIVISLIAITWYASGSLRDFYITEITVDLQARAILTGELVSEYMDLKKSKELMVLCRKFGKETSTRITVILPDGEVTADSHNADWPMENHANRPEVEKALKGEIGRETRYSTTLGQEMLYLAIPIVSDGEIVGVIRTSVSLGSIDGVLGAIYIKIALGGLVIAIIAAAISLVIARKISKPLEEMKFGAELFAKGDLTHTLAVPDSQEIGGLAEAMNQMARELDDRIKTMTRQRNEQQAVLSSMVEGVIAVDNEQRIISLNKAAARLIGTDKQTAAGKTLLEAVRNVELQKLVEKAIAKSGHVEGQVIFHEHGRQQFFRVHGTALRDGQQKKIGALIVLNDITRIRRLEKVRRDFVANVSHELRTPITSIKGFIETLLDGAINDQEDSQRFMEIIARQTDRLSAIIEDLLALSRIEQQVDQTEVELESSCIKPTISAAVQLCSIKAEKREISIETTCDASLKANINPSLLEQAIVNLVDNAIKYSDDGSTVNITAAEGEEGVSITVTDNGCGIEEKYLPRLFERFYRVDKARSRKLGGTGLGLAIVKHIAQAHNGTVWAQSKPGEGSSFSIRLPKQLI